MNEELFSKFTSVCFKLFIKDQNIAECLYDFPEEISQDFINFVDSHYMDKYQLYNRHLFKANKSLLITQSLRSVIKDYKKSL